MDSIWTQSVQIPARESLPGDCEADAAVIGAGLTGILTAHFLQEMGLRVVVLERGRIAGGQTKNTTAKITAQHGLFCQTLRNHFGAEKARLYVEANLAAVAKYNELIEQREIDCDFTACTSYIYTTEDPKVLHAEHDAAREIGLDVFFTDRTPLPLPVTGALGLSGQAHFHPLKFIRAIAEPLTVYEQTRVTGVEETASGGIVITDRGRVRAKHVIMAAHFPFLNVPGFYFARMYQERSYVLALENAPPLNDVFLGIDSDGLSFRPALGCLLMGGGGHRSGEANFAYDMLRQTAARLYPGAAERTRWSAQDCATLDGLPYVGRFAASTPDFYVATGFHKWGMTNAMASALLLSDAVAGRANPYAEVYTPQRFLLPASAMPLIDNSAEAVQGLAKTLFSLPRHTVEAIQTGHAGIVEHEGQKIGVYRDENDRVYMVSVKCPHLGCQLAWNPNEKSWDCPCHGSRFDFQGNFLNGPALRDIVPD